jgi:hypothetical protein
VKCVLLPVKCCSWNIADVTRGNAGVADVSLSCHCRIHQAGPPALLVSCVMWIELHSYNPPNSKVASR